MAGKNNSSKEKMSKKKKIIIASSIVAGILIIIGVVFMVSYFDFGNRTTTDEQNQAEQSDSVSSYSETASTTDTEPICWIVETEKEKALAIQEYTSNALLELASAETEEDIDGGMTGDDTEDTEEASTEEDTSSSNASSSSGSSGSSSNKSSSSGNNSSTSSGSSSSSSNKSSSSGSSSSHKHSYTSTVTKQPTCSSTGVRTYTCSCGDSYTEEIAATGHTWVEYTYTEEVWHQGESANKFVCGQCGAYFDTREEAAAHLDETYHISFSNCRVTLSESYMEYVEHTGYKCSVCGATK